MWHSKIMGNIGDTKRISKKNCKYTYKIKEDNTGEFFYLGNRINGEEKVYKGQKFWFEPNKLESKYGKEK